MLSSLSKQADDYKRCVHCGKNPQITTDEAFKLLEPHTDEHILTQIKKDYEHITWYYYLLLVLKWDGYCPGPGWRCNECEEKRQNQRVSAERVSTIVS